MTSELVCNVSFVVLVFVGGLVGRIEGVSVHMGKETRWYSCHGTEQTYHGILEHQGGIGCVLHTPELLDGGGERTSGTNHLIPR